MLQGPQQGLVVVDQQDPGHVRPAGWHGDGMVKTNGPAARGVVDPMGRPWASTKALAMARPRPARSPPAGPG